MPKEPLDVPKCSAEILWLVANTIGNRAPLLWTVNVWTGTLLVVIALDLTRQHVPSGTYPPSRLRAAAPNTHGGAVSVEVAL
jgi:hypothetical protein